MLQAVIEKNKKSTPFGVNLMKSPVLYRVAQVQAVILWWQGSLVGLLLSVKGQFHPASGALMVCLLLLWNTCGCRVVLLSVMHNDHVRTKNCYNST